MLALKDKRGFVAASVPGLARMAVVGLDECRMALKELESPDPDSKSSDNEGRRIKSVEGGWMILGHERFQRLMKEVSTKVGSAKRQKEFRARKQALGSGDTSLKGEHTAIRMEQNGATQEQLDAHQTSALPPQCQ
jgi:hypothetical protein